MTSTFGSPGANLQRLIQQTGATADGTGKMVLQFPGVPEGYVWDGTVTVPGAPSSAVWLVGFGIGGTTFNISTMLGASPYGPVQLFGGDVLVLTGTGLTPGQQLSAVLIGTSIAEDYAVPSYIQPQALALSTIQAAVTASITGAVQTQANAESLLNTTVPNGHATTNFTINPNPFDHSLQVGWDSGAAVADFKITGNTSNIVYFNGTLNPGQTISVPINGIIDASCAVSIGLNYGAFLGGKLTIAGEPTPGIINVATPSTNQPLPVGPFRTRSVSVTGTSPTTVTVVSGIPGFRIACGACTFLMGASGIELHLTDSGGGIIAGLISNASQVSFPLTTDYLGSNGGTIQVVAGGAAGSFRVSLVYDFIPVY